MEYTVRPMVAQDLAPERGFFETLSNLKPTPPPTNADEILQHMHLQGTVQFVAVLADGTIVGALALLVERKFLRGGALAAHIEDVATRKGYEGKGIGKALVAAAVAHAQHAGCYKIILDCEQTLEPFYQKCGFSTFAIAMRKDF